VDPSPITYQVLANGSVEFFDGTHSIGSIEPSIFSGGWQYHTFGLSMDPTSDLQGVCALNDGVTVTLKATVEPVPGGLHFHYSLMPNQDFSAEAVRVPIYFRYSEWQGSSFQWGPEQGTISTGPIQDESVLGSSNKETLILGPSKTLNGLTVTFQHRQGTLSLLDLRKWNPDLAACFTQDEPVTQSWTWKASDPKNYDFTLTFNRPLGAWSAGSAPPSNGLSGDWHGYFSDGAEKNNARISALIRPGSKKGYEAHFTFDDGYLAYLSRIHPVVTYQKGTLKALYPDGNSVELKLDPSGQTVVGQITAWGYVSPLRMDRGADFKTPRLDQDQNPVTGETYQTPSDLHDGLAVSDLRSRKRAYILLTAGVDEILKGSISNVHSLLVYHKGQLLLDEYFYGYRPQQPHPLFSVTKSVFGTLFGIAQDQGLVRLDQKLYDLYPTYRSQPGWDPKKNDITLAMLLSMDSGFACDNLADSCAMDIYKSKDWLDYTLSLPLNHLPGQHWTYNGTSLIPISNWITEKSGMSISDFAQKYLEGPLGIPQRDWAIGPNHVTQVDTNHWLTPREMLKIGILYLNKGEWNGQQIVSKDWIKQATRPEAAKDQPRDFEYGYLWWIKTMKFGNRTIPIIEANGWGGQYIFVVPNLDLVCVMTAGNYAMGSSFQVEEDFFKKYILTAFYEKRWWRRLWDYF